MNEQIIRKEKLTFEDDQIKKILLLDNLKIGLLINDFGEYSEKNLTDLFIIFIKFGIISILFIGKGASSIEKMFDELLVTKYLESGKSSYLDIITISEEKKTNLQEKITEYNMMEVNGTIGHCLYLFDNK